MRIKGTDQEQGQLQHESSAVPQDNGDEGTFTTLPGVGTGFAIGFAVVLVGACTVRCWYRARALPILLSKSLSIVQFSRSRWHSCTSTSAASIAATTTGVTVSPTQSIRQGGLESGIQCHVSR